MSSPDLSDSPSSAIPLVLIVVNTFARFASHALASRPHDQRATAPALEFHVPAPPHTTVASSFSWFENSGSRWVVVEGAMEAVVGGVGQVQWALAGHVGGENWNRRGKKACCSYGLARRNPGLSVRCRGGRREHPSKVQAVSADGGGGGGERFGRGGGGGDNGGDGGSESSDGDAGGLGGPVHASGILAWYMDQTNRHPVITKAITSSILNLLGDVFCQLVVDRSDKLDIKRSAVITFLGFILVGPTLHTWYLALSKVVTATGFTGAAIRLVLDQFLFSPAFVALFFASLLTLEGRPKDIVPKIKQDWKPTVVANWKLWIPFQFVNFLFVPQQLQVVFANLVGLAWNVYLSFASHKAVAVAIPSATVDIEMSPFGDEK